MYGCLAMLACGQSHISCVLGCDMCIEGSTLVKHVLVMPTGELRVL